MKTVAASSQEQRLRWSQAAAFAIACIVALLGAVVLAGWLFGLPQLVRFTGTITMKSNTALASLLAGVSLAFLRPETAAPGRQTVGRLAALAIMLLGALTLSEHLADCDLGIDQLLAQEPPGALGVTSPNRMGPPASVCFVLAGIALLLISLRPAWLPLAQGLAITLCFLALLPIIGYLYQAQHLYGLARYTGIAPLTAVLLLLLGIGILCARPHAGLMALLTTDQPGGNAVRSLLLPAIALPLVLGYFRVLGERRQLFDLATGTALLMLFLVVAFLFLLWRNGARVNTWFVTDRAHQAQLHQQEERFRVAQELSLDAFTILSAVRDPQGRIVDFQWEYANPAAGQILQRPPQELRGQRLLQLLPGNQTHSNLFSRYARIVETGQADACELHYEAEGVQGWFRNMAVKLGDGVAVGFSDITPRKQAEEALRQSEQRLNHAQEIANVGSWEWDIQTGTLLWSEQVFRQLGYQPNQVQPSLETFFQCLHPLDRALYQTAINQALSGLSVYDLELRLFRPDGAMRVLHTRGELLPGPDGRPRRMLGVSVDITERKRREVLDRAQNQISQLLHSTLSLEEIMQRALSETAAALESETASISLRQGSQWVVSFVQGLAPEVRGTRMSDQEEPHAVLALNTGKPVAISDAWNDPRANREHMIRWNVRSVMVIPLLGKTEPAGVLFLNYHQAPRAFSGVEEDFAMQLATSLSLALQNARLLEELRLHADNLERTVASRTAKLQETIGELEHFSYAIVHDLRAPLRAMQGFASMIEEECAACERSLSKQYLHRIKIASCRMDQLIADSLNYSKVARLELPLEPVNLYPLIDGLVQTYPNLQPDQAHIQVDPQLPRVFGNEAALTQCFSNLLGNAAKFTKPGTKPQIRVRAHDLPHPPANLPNAPSSPNQFVRVWVEDQGIGIRKEAQQRIFDMFQRASADHEGTGIGLAIVRKVVERMGGQVGVESDLGHGSRFWVDLLKAP